ncbi:MAG: uncharacterized membrane protein (UPF0127 family) [Candidatus Paceibacteria bacterium]|jgi:uncharacterized membrane protein (UPF0127 family)
MLSLITWPIKVFIKLVVIFSIILSIFLYLVLSGGDDLSYATRDIGINEKTISVQLSDNDEKRTKGLSGREELSGGMLFVFDKEDLYGIWMKDMNFSLDIIWMNDDREIVHIEKGVSPDTFPKVFKPTAESLYVLEVNSGFVEEEGIEVGQVFTF